jgi:hypothetical protein
LLLPCTCRCFLAITAAEVLWQAAVHAKLVPLAASNQSQAASSPIEFNDWPVDMDGTGVSSSSWVQQLILVLQH